MVVVKDEVFFSFSFNLSLLIGVCTIFKFYYSNSLQRLNNSKFDLMVHTRSTKNNLARW